MTPLRRLACRHAGLAGWLFGLALLLRLLMPSGYMVDTAGGRLAITLCSGHAAMPMPVAMAMPGGSGHEGHEVPPRTDAPCAFAGLLAPGLAAVDLLPFAPVLAFAVGTARTVAHPTPPPAHTLLRPPSRGPPAGR